MSSGVSTGQVLAVKGHASSATTVLWHIIDANCRINFPPLVSQTACRALSWTDVDAKRLHCVSTRVQSFCHGLIALWMRIKLDLSDGDGGLETNRGQEAR